MKINDKVKIIMGLDKGKIGIYKGKRNNSNWYIVLIGEDIVYVNKEELALYD